MIHYVIRIDGKAVGDVMVNEPFGGNDLMILQTFWGNIHNVHFERVAIEQLPG